MFRKKIDFIVNKKKIIFKIKNFLDPKFYDQIEKNFPKVNIQEISLEKNFGKKFLDNTGNKTALDAKNETLKKFNNLILSKEFFNFFTKKLFFSIAFSQSNLLRTLKYLRPPIYSSSDEKRLRDIFLSKLKIRYDYSFIKNNGGIVPHVDGQRKYLSLMLYFPKKGINDKEYGTTFWNCDEENYENIHLEDPAKIKFFKSKYKPIYKTPFEANCLYGFVRNNTSWHSVEPLNINNEYLRRSVNINFYYVN